MTDTAALASELRLAVHRLSRQLRLQRPADGLSLSQMSTLFTIWRGGPLSAGEVAAREGVKPPSTTRVLSVLERRGLVTRAVDPGDGRQVLIAITSTGDDMIQRDIRQRDLWLARQLVHLPEADRELLERAVELMSELAGQ